MKRKTTLQILTAAALLACGIVLLLTSQMLTSPAEPHSPVVFADSSLSDDDSSELLHNTTNNNSCQTVISKITLRREKTISPALLVFAKLIAVTGNWNFISGIQHYFFFRKNPAIPVRAGPSYVQKLLSANEYKRVRRINEYSC